MFWLLCCNLNLRYLSLPLFHNSVYDIRSSLAFNAVYVLDRRWRRWRSTITAWLSAQRGLRVKPTTSALTASRSTCAGTDTPPRYSHAPRTSVWERKRENVSVCCEAWLTGQLHCTVHQNTHDCKLKVGRKEKATKGGTAPAPKLSAHMHIVSLGGILKTNVCLSNNRDCLRLGFMWT